MKRPIIYLVFLFLSLCVQASVMAPPNADAGPYRKKCVDYGSTMLGGSPTASGGSAPYTYLWQPTASLSDSTTANPVTNVTVTTTFTVTVTGSNGESRKDTVTVYIYNTGIEAGPDTTIKAGQTITLHGQVAGTPNQVNWMPSTGSIYNQNTLNPNVFPGATTTYTFSAVYVAAGCTLYDYLTVTVIPTSELFFFNTFSPNGDDANDYFFIGNIDKYPDNLLEIYNRYGQKVFNKTGYQNDWDGKYLNSELPAGVYFYILDTRTEAGGKYKGQVTIIR